MMKTLATTIEAKDEYTKGHSYRVAEYSALIAKQLGWSENEVQNLRNAAFLHDIGKIGVPDIARYHHERYDGKGYPDGLKGEEIPFHARIVSVADSYDAMKSRRIYRNSLPDEIIRDEIVKNKGTQFDPQIADIFIELMDKNAIVIEDNNFVQEGDNADIELEAGKFISDVVSTISMQESSDSIDYLTGLPMRSRGQKIIAERMNEMNGCLAFIDMDNLKKVNAIHGHKAGDWAEMNF